MDYPIDVELPEKLKAYLIPPDCPTVTLPKLGKANLCLPLGGKMQGMVDARNAIPDDCTLNFSLLLQLPPLLGSIECLVKILKLIKPLMDFITAVKDVNPPGIANAVGDLLPAGEDLINTCVLELVLGPPRFIRDLLLLIAKILHCIAGTLHSIAQLMGGINLSIQTAKADDNSLLLQQLQCALENAQNQAEAAMGQLDMIAAVLAIAEPFFGLAGVPTITLPTFGSSADAESLDATAGALEQLSQALIKVANAPPECP